MRDPNQLLLLGGAAIAFAAIASYAPRATMHMARRSKMAPPHRTLLLVTRLWFALLALACVALLALPLFQRVR